MQYFKLPKNNTGFDLLCYNITECGDALILWYDSDKNPSISPVVLTDDTITQFDKDEPIHYRDS